MLPTTKEHDALNQDVGPNRVTHRRKEEWVVDVGEKGCNFNLELA